VKDFFKRNPRFFSKGDDKDEREMPEDVWIKCAKCNELIYTKQFEKNQKVCQKCGHHLRLSAAERLSLLLDEGSFEELDGAICPCDPLEFISLDQSYAKKLRQTQEKTGLVEAMMTGLGRIEERPLVTAACDFSFLGGTMGSVFGEKMTRCAETALERGLPLLTISASGGARMHEGIFSLMQMAKTTAAVVRLAEARLPHISILCDPCLGGVSASYAFVADVIIAEPHALIGFAGERVIEQITKQKLPPGFQSAEFLLEHGMIDMVVPRRDLRSTLAKLLRIYATD
jgi:acetyl-CoA carboxylase carboxyl transferase subunit beta